MKKTVRWIRWQWRCVDYFQNFEYVLIHIISERTVKSTVLLNCRKMTDKKEKKL